MKILRGNNDLLKKILELMGTKKLAWIKSTNRYMDIIGITQADLRNLNKDTLKDITKTWDMQIWKDEVNSKASLSIYKERKAEIKEEQIYAILSNIIQS